MYSFWQLWLVSHYTYSFLRHMYPTWRWPSQVAETWSWCGYLSYIIQLCYDWYILCMIVTFRYWFFRFHSKQWMFCLDGGLSAFKGLWSALFWQYSWTRAVCLSDRVLVCGLCGRNWSGEWISSGISFVCLCPSLPVLWLIKSDNNMPWPVDRHCSRLSIRVGVRSRRCNRRTYCCMEGWLCLSVRMFQRVYRWTWF